MNKVKQFLISLLVIFISFLIIDEGRTIMTIGENIEIHLNHNQNKELEIPHHHNFNRCDVEKWIGLNSFKFLCSSSKLLLFPNYLNKGTEDYTGFVWQPPKSYQEHIFL
jgi:hypothetical protein